MNHTIDRDSDAMELFAKALGIFIDNLDSYLNNLISNCDEAEPLMQDQSAQSALQLIRELSEELKGSVNIADNLKSGIINSARLIVQSNDLI